MLTATCRSARLGGRSTQAQRGMENARTMAVLNKARSPSAKISWVALSLIAAMSVTTTARAETGTEKAKTGAKGTVGLALLGAETVVAVEALIGVKPWWGYAIGGGLGAIAGGVGGYFIDRMDKPAVSMGLLAGGLTLAIPTTIAVLAATAYRPEKNPEIDRGKADSTALQRTGELALMQDLVERHASAHQRFQRGFVNVDAAHKWALGMPEINVIPALSAREQQMSRLAYLSEGPNAPSFRSVVLNLSF